jgi:hypothetical protein
LAVSPVRELTNVPVPEPSVVRFPAIVGLTAVLQQTPLAETAVDPAEVTFPPEVAVVEAIALAAVVVTTGRLEEVPVIEMLSTAQ